MKKIDWYFDFISPFAYLQWQLFKSNPIALNVNPVPLLFAGLLSHWDNKGPVEIAPKRNWTYQNCVWIAHRHGIPFQLPSQHPFNPLQLLRLCIALGSSRQVVDRLFCYVWEEGHLPADVEAWDALLQELQASQAMLETADIKTALRKNGEQAIAAGVFGVPTAVIDKRCFWGVEATDMLMAYLQDDPFFTTAEFERAGNLPQGQQRIKAA